MLIYLDSCAKDRTPTKNEPIVHKIVIINIRCLFFLIFRFSKTIMIIFNSWTILAAIPEKAILPISYSSNQHKMLGANRVVHSNDPDTVIWKNIPGNDDMYYWIEPDVATAYSRKENSPLVLFSYRREWPPWRCRLAIVVTLYFLHTPGFTDTIPGDNIRSYKSPADVIYFLPSDFNLS